MLTPNGVGFYSYMTAMVFGDTSISVDEVTSPRFLLSAPGGLDLKKRKRNTKLKRTL